jgi:hypothetical protein
MDETPRLVLWANDSPRNAVDDVCESVVADIERYLTEAEEDSCFVNDVLAYVRCLTGIYDWAGGAYVEYERLEHWRNRAVSVVKQMPAAMFDDEEERIADVTFINEVFDDLRGIVSRMYD